MESLYHLIYFAVDNVDLEIVTVDGKGQLHGTGIVAYQRRNVEQRVWATL